MFMLTTQASFFTSLCNFPGMSREDEVFHSGISSAVQWRSVPCKSKIVDGCCRMPMIDIALSFKALNDSYTLFVLKKFYFLVIPY